MPQAPHNPPAPTPRLLTQRDALLAHLGSLGRVVVAFSGGVDSTVVAQAAQLACGERALAVTAVSSSLASGEEEQARDLAARIGIRHQVIHTREFANPDYVKNAPNRCYFCKTELYSRLVEALPASGLEFDTIVNGANLDDRGDHRPGMQAAAEHQVRSPLLECGLTKHDVRELARLWELPVWDKPASPCLSSRIAYGVEATPERVQRVDAAEQFLKAQLNLRELRVRHEATDLARIEVPLNDLPRLLEPATRTAVTAKLKELGFRCVTIDLEGFRSGSLNALVPLDELQVLGQE